MRYCKNILLLWSLVDCRCRHSMYRRLQLVCKHGPTSQEVETETICLQSKSCPFQGRTTFIFEGKHCLVFAALFKISLPLRCQRQVSPMQTIIDCSHLSSISRNQYQQAPVTTCRKVGNKHFPLVTGYCGSLTDPLSLQ